jgi:hypothetical protein
MNDEELITTVRESYADVHSATTAGQIVKRGRTVRARRQIPGVAAAVGVAAAAAVAVSVALPASHSAASHAPAVSHPAVSHPANGPGVQLAAWTVTRQADGNIQVTFRQATDAAGLQRTLRADGVPASVTFTGHQNPACQPYPSSSSQAGPPPGQPFSGPAAGVVPRDFLQNPKQAYTTPYALVIHPSALPSGAGLQIWTSGTPGAADNFLLDMSVVKASPQCTGS